MEQNWERAYQHLRAVEGGLSDHPADPGGRTNLGVTQQRFDDYNAERNAPARPVDEITEGEVKAIFREHWDWVGASDLAAGLDIAAADASLLCGPGRARSFLRETQDPDVFVFVYERYLESRPHARTFIKGWKARLAKLRAVMADVARDAPDHPAPWLDIAVGEVGIAEVPGARHNPRILEYASVIGLDWVKKDEEHWCATFVGYCLERTGYASTRSALARSYTKWGKRLPKPRPGAIAVWPRTNNPAFGHVNIVKEVRGGSVVCIGGNVANRVKIEEPRSSANAIGFYWPTSRMAVAEVTGGWRWKWSNAPEFDLDVKRVQARLRALGYAVGEIDGQAGPATRRAVNAFTEDMGLKGEDGAWYAAYDEALAKAPSVVPEARREITADGLASRNPLVRMGLFLRRTLMGLLALLGIDTAVDSAPTESFPAFMNVVKPAFDAIGAAGQWVFSSPWGLLAVGLFALVLVEGTVRRQLRAYRHNDDQGAFKEVRK